MPPSPLLSARIITNRYLIVITQTIDQTMSERMPITLSGVSGMPYSGLKAVFSAYSGLVPMSPKTTPMAPRTRAARALRCSGECCAEADAVIFSNPPGRLAHPRRNARGLYAPLLRRTTHGVSAR